MKQERRRIVRVRTDDGPRHCVVLDGEVNVLTGDLSGHWETTKRLGTADSVSLLPPVVPSKIIGVGLNYRAHAAESNAEIPSEPLLFLKPPSAVVGPDARNTLPPQSGSRDLPPTDRTRGCDRTSSSLSHPGIGALLLSHRRAGSVAGVDHGIVRKGKDHLFDGPHKGLLVAPGQVRASDTI